MKNEEKNSLVGLPIILAIAALLAWAGSRGGQQINGIPIFALSVSLAFIIQWIAFIPAFLFKTEKFYDLTGSLTYLTVTISAVLLSGSPDTRTWLLLTLVIIWAVRLGSFLFTRVLKSGKDSRFDEIKPSLPRFFLTWTLQGLWVSFTLAAALAAITSLRRVPVDFFAVLGFVVWIAGFSIEAIADGQKYLFRSNPANHGRFIRSGLWSWSRHPNYFGEILVWTGVAIIALPNLRGWQYLTLISPIFVYVLLTRISGIPMLERKADEKWGGQADYEQYKASTSLLVPLPPKKINNSSLTNGK